MCVPVWGLVGGGEVGVGGSFRDLHYLTNDKRRGAFFIIGTGFVYQLDCSHERREKIKEHVRE